MAAFLDQSLPLDGLRVSLIDLIELPGDLGFRFLEIIAAVLFVQLFHHFL